MIFCQVLGRVSVIFIALLFKLIKANISITKPLLELLKKYYGSMPRSTDKKAFKRGLELWAKWQHIQIDVYLLVTCWMSDAIATVGTASGLRDTLPPEWSKQSSVKCLEHRKDLLSWNPSRKVLTPLCESPSYSCGSSHCGIVWAHTSLLPGCVGLCVAVGHQNAKDRHLEEVRRWRMHICTPLTESCWITMML